MKKGGVNQLAKLKEFKASEKLDHRDFAYAEVKPWWAFWRKSKVFTCE